MPTRVRLATLLAVAVSALLALPATGEASVPAHFWGVDSVTEPTGAEFGLMAQTGVEVYRMPMSWAQIEPSAPVNVAGKEVRSYNWAEPDRLITRAAQTGIAPHVTLIDTPYWIDPDPRTSPIRTRKGERGWRDFAAAVVARYGRGGEFWALHPELTVDPPIAYQIWNEMNTVQRYRPRANPKEYAKLLGIAGTEIRAAEPGAEILPGGMFGTPQTPDSYDAWDFMRILLEQPGARKFIDAVGVHPYSPDLRGVRYQLNKMRATLDKAGLPGIPLQVTELGWSSGVHKDKFFFFKGPRGQARLLKRSFTLFLKNRERWNLERVIWFSWRDVNKEEVPPGCTYCRKFGLLHEDLSAKGAYDEYKRFATGKARRSH
jgi:hypothetical protein